MNSNGWWTAASGAAVVAMLCLPAAAQAQTRNFNIAAQSASSGVREFARQAGIQVTLAGRDGEGRSTGAVRGSLDVREALDQLLSGTGLSVRSFDGKVAIIGAETQAESVESIIVTGSRIARAELESAMPVSITRFDNVARVGRLNAYDALRLEPAIAPGAGSYSANFHSGGDAGNAGAAFINLRNLGANRTLTLIDGRRRVSATASASAVDLNMIPPAMIERLEVVTGGAAAIYGADAVTGAVNIITKRDPKGLHLTVYQGISQRGDVPETNVSLTTGGTFADGRGSFIMGGTYLKTGDLHEKDRAFSVKRISHFANPLNTGPTDGIPDNITNRDFIQFFNSEVPMMYIPANNGYYHISGGQVFQSFYDKTYSTGELGLGEGTNNPQFARSWNYYGPMRLAEETVSAIAKFDYEVADDIHYGARLDYGRTLSSGIISRYREDSRLLFGGGFGGPKAYLDNPYMPDSVRKLMTSFGLSSANIDRWYDNWPRIETLPDRQSLTIDQTLFGEIGRSLRWEAFYQYGRSTNDITVTNMPLTARWVAARDVIADPVTGQPVCRDAAQRAAGCVPYNIFGNDPLTAAQKAWMLVDLRSTSVNKQELFGASLSGRLFALPYGDVSFAIGAERRTESGKLTVDPRVSGGQIPLNGFTGSIQSVPVNAAMSVSEGYAELVVPVLRDLPFIRRLEIEGAYRYSKYSTIGSTDTWKVGATWEPLEGFTIRGVRSRSVRVPNFGELYAPITNRFIASVNDPCLAVNANVTPTRAANCKALGVPTNLAFYSDDIATRSGGNPNLTPETSDSFTVGLVAQPRFIRGFDMTIDYWDIRIKDAVTSFDQTVMMNQCVDLPTIDNIFCANVRRAATGKINFISTAMVNAASLEARGLDVGLNYTLPVLAGDLSLAFKGSYLLDRTIQNIPGVSSSLLKYAGGYADPKFRAFLLTTYSLSDYSVTLGTQFISASLFNPNAIPDQYDDNSIPAMVYNDLSASRSFGDRFDLTFGVKNLFDAKPPMLPDVYSGGGGRYDTVGRYFFTRIGVKL